ncbi:MAG: tyrosine-protein phosphatase, partial [Chloroflexota bacterium]
GPMVDDGPGARHPAIPNFRDLGGHRTTDGRRVRPGLVYRSTEMSRLVHADAARLVALGVRTIYDLRTDGERRQASEVERLPLGIEYVVADVVGDSPGESPMRLFAHLDSPAAGHAAFGDGRAEAMFRDNYRGFVLSPSAREAYARVFGGLADRARLPAVFHCTTGKDRTGWAAAVLLTLLGVPEKTVRADFLASTAALRPVMGPLVARYVAGGGDARDLAPLVGVLPVYLEDAFDEMRTTFGSVEGYFTDGLGLRADSVTRLRDTLLEAA